MKTPEESQRVQCYNNNNKDEEISLTVNNDNFSSKKFKLKKNYMYTNFF